MVNYVMLNLGVLIGVIALVILIGNFFGDNSLVGAISLGVVGAVLIVVSQKYKNPQ